MPNAESNILRKALEQIVASQRGECERYTTGIGACFAQGHSTDSPYYDSRCCHACIAHSALMMEGLSRWPQDYSLPG